ncbi:MAG: ornithine cyclodeaminase family protein, partial [Pseudomonadota bacterium]
MIVVPEAVAAELVTPAMALDAVEAVFGAMSRGDAYNFPVIREAIGHADALYGFKSGFDRAGLVLGLKSGGYWPGNADKGLTNHQSTVILFDADTGRPKAMVGGNYLTAVRTAAASAVSIKHLARGDAKVLGMVGAGHQSAFQMRAAAAQRSFEKVVGWNPHPEMLGRLADTAAELGLPFEAVSTDQLGAEADVIITITSAFEPLLMRGQIRPGTHIACMGTDTKGKQEVDP